MLAEGDQTVTRRLYMCSIHIYMGEKTCQENNQIDERLLMANDSPVEPEPDQVWQTTQKASHSCLCRCFQ